jgi:hypothetical protein
MFLREVPRPGFSRWTAAPPIYRLAWWAGIRVRPPVFQSFAVRAVLFGAFWWILFPLLALIANGWFVHFELATAIVLGAVGAVTLGVFMSFHYQMKALWLDLPDWDDYGESR